MDHGGYDVDHGSYIWIMKVTCYRVGVKDAIASKNTLNMQAQRPGHMRARVGC